MDKRNFIKTLGALSVSSLVSPSELTKIKSISYSLPKIKSDEELWTTVRSHYTLKDDYINLESGYYSICLLYTSPSPRDLRLSRMPSSA